MTMQLANLISEKAELDVRVARMQMLISGETFNGLPDAQEQARILRQLTAMELYQLVLGERITAQQTPSKPR